MKKKIVFTIGAILCVSALLFFLRGNNAPLLLSEKTVEALTEGDFSWQDAKIPSSKTIVHTVESDDKVNNITFSNYLCAIFGGGVTAGSGACTLIGGAAGWAAAGGWIGVIGGAAVIVWAAVNYEMEYHEVHKGEQYTCCGDGCGNCYPYAPDKSSIEMCQSLGFKVASNM